MKHKSRSFIVHFFSFVSFSGKRSRKLSDHHVIGKLHLLKTKKIKKIKILTRTIQLICLVSEAFNYVFYLEVGKIVKILSFIRALSNYNLLMMDLRLLNF